MVLDHKGVIDQFANLARGRSRLNLVKIIQGLGRGHVVGGRANPADAAGDLRHVLRGPAQAEDLEAAQFRDLQVSAFHLALVIQENINFAVAFQPGNRVNRHPAPLGVGGGIGAGRAFIPNFGRLGVHCGSLADAAGRLTLRRNKLFPSP